ncbi:hypothetical protein PPERSA_09101 [Pseudocohnilembus persalinus]|uniref:Uncharacterized protein n=1 Tax=Pseudocohnilembus persalinus TaxID=266149 RepID=A0A0V0QWT1_PSEPJ|nr:hypothetical protein PPERSA_09101 [Pseudocohnilembus persalinus]|eukprot:KRX06699.1 hypothetical protein PPERSA_09101 [Pseudocohnilembus persalinus]
MSQKKWDEIDPKYVPSICFQRYKNVFLNSKEIDDEKRKALKLKYEEHIKNAAEKKDGAKINAKRLFIDTIVEEALQLNQYNSTEIQQQTINAQMIDIVEDVKKMEIQ